MNDGTSHTLANAELAVMDLLWNSDRSMTAREFRENLYPDQAQHGTVQRLLQRLEEKGFIERDRSNSVHFFAAKITRENYAGQQLETLADKLTAGSFTPLITNLVERKRISKDEIARIRALLDTQAGEKSSTLGKPKNKRNARSKGRKS